MKYKRGELPRYSLYIMKEIDIVDLIRLAAFYTVGVFIGGFSAIFAYVLTLLNGAHGIAGWAWIFVRVVY